MALFDLPGFAGGPALPGPEPTPTPSPAPAPAAEEWEELRVIGDIRAPAEFPPAWPGQRTTLWGDPESASALWGPMAATDPVLGADTTTTDIKDRP
ncbi:hypothetical protein [Nocardia sp. NPDC004711]